MNETLVIVGARAGSADRQLRSAKTGYPVVLIGREIHRAERHLDHRTRPRSPQSRKMRLCVKSRTAKLLCRVP